MISQQEYVVSSLELHLFFARTMKEHAIFLESGFTPKDTRFSKTADQYKRAFSSILNTAVQLSNGIISEYALISGEFITKHTLASELQTQSLTGIPINTNITKATAKLCSSDCPPVTPELVRQVRRLNNQANRFICGLIAFKTQVLENVLACNMYTTNYPLLIEHILHEAGIYLDHVRNLEDDIPAHTDLIKLELCWDQLMMEHALFIRGLLDPCENDLITMANDFAGDYNNLLSYTAVATNATIHSITQATLQETTKYSKFKDIATEGILSCDIRSILQPLLADHVLREANHYIKLLQQYR